MNPQDVDLRFVERSVPAPPEFGPDVSKTIRVLQWRKMQWMETENGQYGEWTDWQDVPLVLGAL